jgi:hypothetical protein
VGVDQAGQNDVAPQVEDLVRFHGQLRGRTHVRDHPVSRIEAAAGDLPARSVMGDQDCSVADEQSAHDSLSPGACGVFFVVNMMAIGLHQEPRGAYMPSVGY